MNEVGYFAAGMFSGFAIGFLAFIIIIIYWQCTKLKGE